MLDELWCPQPDVTGMVLRQEESSQHVLEPTSGCLPNQSHICRWHAVWTRLSNTKVKPETSRKKKVGSWKVFASNCFRKEWPFIWRKLLEFRSIASYQFRVFGAIFLGNVLSSKFDMRTDSLDFLFSICRKSGLRVKLAWSLQEGRFLGPGFKPLQA